MPAAIERLIPRGTARRKPRRTSKVAGKKMRKANTAASKGATRRAPAADKPQRQPSVWLNRLLVVVALGAVAAAGAKGWVILDNMPVERITVTGQLQHTQAERLQEMIHTSLHGGFLSADLEAMRIQLEELPWIFQVSVRRLWPNALEVHVVEQLPVARWGDSGFLNHEGGLFSSDASRDWQGLPLLSGPEGSEKALVAKYQRLVELLSPFGLGITRLATDSRGQVEATLSNGIALILGGRAFRERMQRFTALYRSELMQHAERIERIDLRYTAGVAVAFTEEAQEQVAGLMPPVVAGQKQQP